jgi:hypothetical protein
VSYEDFPQNKLVARLRATSTSFSNYPNPVKAKFQDPSSALETLLLVPSRVALIAFRKK